MSLNSHNPALSTVDQHKLLQEEADYSPSFQHGLLPFPHRRIFSKLILDSTVRDLHLSREEFLFQFEDSVILLSYLPVWNANQSSSLLQLSSCLRAQLNFYRTLSTCFRQTCKIRSWFIFLYVFCLGTFWIKQIPLWFFFCGWKKPNLEQRRKTRHIHDVSYCADGLQIPKQSELHKKGPNKTPMGGKAAIERGAHELSRINGL